MTITPEQIEEIRARAEAATPGPWAYDCTSTQDNDYMVGLAHPVDGDDGSLGPPISGRLIDHPHHFDPATQDFGEWYCEPICEITAAEHSPEGSPAHDAAFIAHARTDIPLLISALEAEKAKLFEVRATIKLLEGKNAELTRTAAAHMRRADEAEAALKENSHDCKPDG